MSNHKSNRTYLDCTDQEIVLGFTVSNDIPGGSVFGAPYGALDFSGGVTREGALFSQICSSLTIGDIGEAMLEEGCIRMSLAVMRKLVEGGPVTPEDLRKRFVERIFAPYGLSPVAVSGWAPHPVRADNDDDEKGWWHETERGIFSIVCGIESLYFYVRFPPGIDFLGDLAKHFGIEDVEAERIGVIV